MRGRERDTGGFSLVELVIVIAVSGILFAALATFTRTSLSATAVVQGQNFSDQTARTALARLRREATLAKLISAAEQYRLAFTCTDITGDGADDTVEYSWDSGSRTLRRTLNGATETFAEGVTLFRLEYQYKSETNTTIVAPGNMLPVTLGVFQGLVPGGSVTVEDVEIDVRYDTWYIEQCFQNLVETPAATSVTLRARTKDLPPPVDTYITLDDMSQTLAYGWLMRSQLTTTFQDIAVPLTWTGGPGVKMLVDKVYRLRIRPGGPYPYYNRSATLLYQRIKTGPLLGGGLTLGYWNGLGFFVSLGGTASLYFTVSGNLPVTTPRRTSTPVSVLKTIKARITTSSGSEVADMTRTCSVVNQ